MDVSIYVHIPFCSSKCPYCDFNSVRLRGPQVPQDYIEAVLKELSGRSGGIQTGNLRSVYFGGGTPSLASPEDLGKVLKSIERLFPKGVREITMECNPCTYSRKRMDAFRDIGINRFIVGVQSFAQDDLRVLGRRHTPVQSEDFLNYLSKTGFKNFGLDLIYGIPGQDIRSWSQNLEHALSFGARHISAYCLTLEEGTPMNDRVRKGELALPDDDELNEMFLLTSEKLKQAGYEHYEISNYALDGSRSVHNSMYWEGASYLGLGAGAHSFDAKELYRSWNISDPETYTRALIREGSAKQGFEKINETQRRIERMFLSLRTSQGTNLGTFSYEKRADLDNFLKGQIRAGLLIQQDDRIRLTERGFLVCNEMTRKLLDFID